MTGSILINSTELLKYQAHALFNYFIPIYLLNFLILSIIVY